MKDWDRCQISRGSELQRRFQSPEHSLMKLTWSKTLELGPPWSEWLVPELSSTVVGAQGLVLSPGSRNLRWVLQKAGLTCESRSLELSFRARRSKRKYSCNSLIYSFIYSFIDELEMKQWTKRSWNTLIPHWAHFSNLSDYCPEFSFNTFLKYKPFSYAH